METLILMSVAIVVLEWNTIEASTENKHFFLSNEDDRKPKAVNQQDLKWDVGSSLRERRQVLKDHRHPNTTWQAGVSYTFNTSAKDKVVVVKDQECYSIGVGRLGGDQLFSLNDNATEASAVHEIGHVLGLYHTMSRYDRDNYIRIIERNIDPLEIGQFIKSSTNYSDVYGLRYDYGSIMHYDELSYSVNNMPTMIARDRYYQKTMGSELISFSDIFMINEHYGCNARCNKSTSAKCVNGGYPHPRNCSKCICPSGYGGPLCDRRPTGCGGELVAKSRVHAVTYRLGFGTALRDHFDFCNFMITAPEGKKVEVEIRSIPQDYEKAGCPKGGVEVKAQKNQKMTGYRFCSMSGSAGPVVSSSNRLPVIVFNKLGMLHGMFQYRYTD